jgi:ABC-type nickel/cobalt efflux system permease component RcnA
MKNTSNAKLFDADYTHFHTHIHTHARTHTHTHTEFVAPTSDSYFFAEFLSLINTTIALCCSGAFLLIFACGLLQQGGGDV